MQQEKWVTNSNWINQLKKKIWTRNIFLCTNLFK